ncbi:MAG: pyridoxal-phosphate dependent enzyme [Chloroflexi bacterium]|nr:MAG: pyridoxal-phosphate dependent enzyme [Chloroflexota bacterium]
MSWSLADVEASLGRLPRLQLATLPTPLQEAPRLAAAIGLDRLLIKRDDNTGLAFGGNKARKLEYLVADAARLGADVLVTLGAPQSNHCRMTAAAARVAGLECRLVFAGQPIEQVQGNMWLDRFFGATWTFAGDRPAPECMASVADELRASGRNPYVIPGGGSNGLGALGYVSCAFELAQQLRERGEHPRYVVCAGGSCGTLSGLTLGVALSGIDAEVVGVSISRSVPDRVAKVRQIMAESCGHLDLPVPDASPTVWGDYIGRGYGMATELSQRALETVAFSEGILLDPVYTAKAFGGLMGEIEAGRVRRSDLVVFVHTGGTPALFADPAEYSSRAQATFEGYGEVTYLVRGGEAEVLEGDWQPKRFFIIRFEDREKAMTWYNSQPYREVMKLRLASSTSNLFMVEGNR